MVIARGAWEILPRRTGSFTGRWQLLSLSEQHVGVGLSTPQHQGSWLIHPTTQAMGAMGVGLATPMLGAG